MSNKKHLKRLKELQRLQELYKDSGATTKSASVLDMAAVEHPHSAKAEAVAVASDPHSIIRRDLIFLTILIVAMLAALVALTWLVDNTTLGEWVLRAAGVIAQ